ncbi:hypothetical protein F5Y02DRAFT_124582 [Annulohypoxylon stygium]|nr:hypothetical protein F5Y02DRAFT_124582 [Annulohypoxylon stygium]
MDSQREPYDTCVPNSQAIPVDESQQDQAMTSPPTDDNSSELSTAMDNNADNRMMEGNRFLTPNKAGGDDTSVPAMSSPQAIGTFDGSSDLRAMGNSTIRQDIEMEGTAPNRQATPDNLAPILTLTSQSPKHTSGNDNEMDVDSSTASQKESTGGHPTTSQGEAERILTLVLRTRPQPPTTRTTTKSIEVINICHNFSPVGTVTMLKSKRPWDPPDMDDLADRIDASMPTDAQRTFVFKQMAERLMKAWQEVLERCGMRLGSKEAMTLVFKPDLDAIAPKAMRRWPLDRVAEVVESELLEQWATQCHRIIARYSIEMYGRSMVAEAQQTVPEIRDRVLEEAERVTDPSEPPATPHTPRPLRIPSSPVLRDGLFHFPATPPIRPTAFPTLRLAKVTPQDNKRRVVEDMDTLRSQIAGLDINRKDNRDGEEEREEEDGMHTPFSEVRYIMHSPRGIVSSGLPRALSTSYQGRLGMWDRGRNVTPTRSSRTGRPTRRVLGEDGDVDMGVGSEARRQIEPYPVMGPLIGVAMAGNEEAGEDDGNDAGVDVSAKEDNGKECKDEGDDDVFS